MPLAKEWPALLRVIKRDFKLDGERLLRKGKEVKTDSKHKYVLSFVGEVDGKKTYRGYHRIKFFLAHGFMPVSVDHIDGNPQNNALDNLRAANPLLQTYNRRIRKNSRGLPRGVSPSGSGYAASLKYKGRQTYLGTYKTVGEASAAVEGASIILHGAFYVNHGASHL